MDCRKAEELFEPYLLGALDNGDRLLMDSHLDTCLTCSVRLHGEGETVARLAFTVPQVEPPSRIKQRLLSRIEAEAAPRPDRLGLSRGLAPHAAKAVALTLVVGLVFAGVWFNSRLNELSVDNEAQVKKMVNDQRFLTSMTAAPGVSVNMLYGTEHSVKAWGMLACCSVSDGGPAALLVVLNLPPLPRDNVYQVWLIKNKQRHQAGTFTVDSTGYGQAVIIPVVPFAEFDAIGITIEHAGRGDGLSRTGVLKGDLSGFVVNCVTRGYSGDSACGSLTRARSLAKYPSRRRISTYHVQV